ncbi:hypothetical protein [Streptomyces sp. NPDC086787]|uniref:hypothetical protein n=1 Tax=Streptomyces sp. NPDC086787 TaxID=3365759 RepID=UPI0038022E26
MKRIPHVVAALALGTLLAAGTAACTESTAKADGTGVTEKLPADTDKARSKQNAQEFRSWVKEHGTPQQKDAAALVERIIGEWDTKTGNAYISTDINGGESSMADPQSTAAAIAKAFDSWKDSKEGHASVYDVYGNAVVTDYEF